MQLQSLTKLPRMAYILSRGQTTNKKQCLTKPRVFLFATCPWKSLTTISLMNSKKSDPSLIVRYVIFSSPIHNPLISFLSCLDLERSSSNFQADGLGQFHWRWGCQESHYQSQQQAVPWQRVTASAHCHVLQGVGSHALRKINILRSEDQSLCFRST